MKKMSLNQVVETLQLPPLFEELQVTNFQIDSRNILPGSLFFALPGLKTDGHCHLEEAQRKGALGAVVKEGYLGPGFGLRLFSVPDVLEALQKLARKEVETGGFRVAAVTGSVGKTTTKDFWAEFLSQKFLVGKTEGSQNSKLTLPLTILNREGGEDLLVLEMGMSEPYEIEKLVSIAPPEVSILTQVALAHAENFEDGLLGIAKEKKQILKKAKKAIFPYEFLVYSHLIDEIEGEKITFSLQNKSADYFLSVETGILDEKGVRVYQFDLPFKEVHFLHNFLAAVAGSRAFGLGWDEINQKVKHLKLPKMRFEQFEKNGILFINDGYNSNPASLQAALESFPKPKDGGKKIAVLGPMGGLGKISEQMHLEIGKLAQKHVDQMLVCGDEAKALLDGFAEGAKPAEFFFDQKELARRLKELMRPGDVVLVKARRMEKMEEIFTFLETDSCF